MGQYLNLYLFDIIMTCTKFTHIFYADDTTLLSTLDNLSSDHTKNSITNQINAELTVLTGWLAVSMLSLNAKKTKMVMFHSKQRIPRKQRNS